MNQEYKKHFIHAGNLAKQVRSFGKSLLKKGASYNDVIKKINQKIEELGAIPAFPPQIALNDVAAHFLVWPGDDLIFLDQIVKLDVGVCYQGAIGDCAVTVDLSGNFSRLIEAVEAALLAAESVITVGFPIREIGKIIHETILSYEYNPVKNLSGHGLGKYQVHRPPTIPNYDDGSKGVIKPGMTFAIEPFATNGHGLIYEWGQPAIFSLFPSRFHKRLKKSFLYDRIKQFNGLPFAIHNLLQKGVKLHEVESELKELLKKQAIIGYPPLVEQMHGVVAQAENSVLVDLDGNVVVTTR